jgi:hypothetical protein
LSNTHIARLQAARTEGQRASHRPRSAKDPPTDKKRLRLTREDKLRREEREPNLARFNVRQRDLVEFTQRDVPDERRTEDGDPN